ncbi:hypothetical protein [Spirosoma horti]
MQEIYESPSFSFPVLENSNGLLTAMALNNDVIKARQLLIKQR